MSTSEYSLQHAKSSRAKCKTCKETITKGNIKMVRSVPNGDYNLDQSFHVKCVPFPRNHKALGAEGFLDEMVVDASDDQSILPDKREEILEALEAALSKPKKSSKATSKDEDPDSFFGRVRRAAEEGESHEGPPKKKAKTSSGKDNEEEEIKEFAKHYNELRKMNVDSLKDYLRWNGVVLKGNKDFVLFKVCDGMVHGRLARCPLDGGRLKFNEGDYEDITCDGEFDEAVSTRIPCTFKGHRTDPKLRVQPFYTREPTKEEKDAMEAEKQASGSGAAGEVTEELSKGLLEAARKLHFELNSQQDIKDATYQLLDIVDNKIDLPDDKNHKRLVGEVVNANQDKDAEGIMDALIKKFGFKKAKEVKKAAVAESLEAKCANPKNAPLVQAFKELSDFYFLEKNQNAGATYKKVLGVLTDLEIEVTADNAMSMSKGKTKVAGIGKASAEKMKEFMETGTMEKLEEKRAIHSA